MDKQTNKQTDTNKSKPEKCISKDRHSKPCRNFAEDNSKYCKNHKYLENYTPEQLANLALCSGCNKWVHLENSKKRCTNCLGRSKVVNKNIKDKRQTEPKCMKCAYKADEKGKYCGKHAAQYKIEELAAALKDGQKICYNFMKRNTEDNPALGTKGCSKIAADGLSKCRNCLDVDNLKDRIKRANTSKLK